MKKNEKQRSPTFLENLNSYFSQYCRSTSIHGIQYLGERGRFAAEKAIWLVIIVGVCYCCIFLIFKSYDKWVTTPVIVTLSTIETPVWEIPFPAITICPEVKAHPEIFNYTDVFRKKYHSMELTEEEKNWYESMSLICDIDEELEILLGVDSGSPFVDDVVILNLLSLFLLPLRDPSLRDALALQKVVWLGKKVPIESVMSIVPTSMGFCYTFNMLDVDDIIRNSEGYMKHKTDANQTTYKWSLDGGYPDKNLNESYPRRTFMSGIDGGIGFSLFAHDSHLDYLCGHALQGFKAIIHNPAEFPDASEFFLIPLDQFMFVGIKPNMIKISDKLRDYSPQDRMCYFSNERPLKYFKNYTQNNCLQECLSNYTLLHCECIPFYMPKEYGSRTCGIAKETCLAESAVNYMATEDEDAKCDCLPSCTSIKYDVETFQANLFWKEKIQTILAILDIVPNATILNEHRSAVLIYFKEKQFLSSERNELYGLVDFFSNTGGLLGLFIGFSVTSAIEIVYFLTLRLSCNIRKYGKKLWSGNSDLVSTQSDQQNVSFKL